MRPTRDRAADCLARQLPAPGRSAYLPRCVSYLSCLFCLSVCLWLIYLSTHLRQVVAVPRLAASCALQQLLTPPPDQRLVYSDPTHAGEGGGEGWPRTPRQAAGEEEDDAGSDTPELQLSRCSSGSSGSDSADSGSSGGGTGSSNAHATPSTPNATALPHAVPCGTWSSPCVPLTTYHLPLTTYHSLLTAYTGCARS